MPISYPPDSVIISDSTVLINFLESGDFKVLLSTFKGGIHVTSTVLGEVLRNKSELQAAIDAGDIIVHEVPIERVQHLCRSFSQLHLGEASCIELAREKTWVVATDDGAAKGHIKSILGGEFVVTTFDIVLRAVRTGIVKREYAADVIRKMEERADFLFGEATYKEFLRKLKDL